MGASRLFAPDALRGLIIVLMALDHASLLVAQKHPLGEYWGGPLPAYGDPLSFLTRFVTHFCAPGFFPADGPGLPLAQAPPPGSLGPALPVGATRQGSRAD
jgi:uncharacterized membrane protein